MTDPLLTYFSAEKTQALVLLGIGIAAIGIAIYFHRSKSPFRGIIYPLVAVGLIQLGAGATIYFRTDAQVAALEAQRMQAPIEFRQAELTRMKGVMASFNYYKWIEIGLLVIGVVLSYWAAGREFWYGVAIGLIIQAGIMLVFDLVAEWRGAAYVVFLEGLPR